MKLTPDSTDTPEDPGKLKDVQQEDYPESIKGLLSDTCLEYLTELDKAIKLLSDAGADILPEVTAERDGIINALESLKGDVSFFEPQKLEGALATIKRINATLEARRQAPAKSLAHLESILPDVFTMANSIVANALPTGIIDGVEHKLNVSNKGKLKILFTGSIEEKDKVGNKIEYTRPFTEFDRLVQEAVTTLYEYGNDYMTVAMIYRQMTGKTDTENCSAEIAKAIDTSINKQSVTRVAIDASEEFEKRKIKDKDGNPVIYRQRRYLLNVDIDEIESGGRVVKVYRINQRPIVYAYSLYKQEVLTTDVKLLDIKKLDKTGRITARSVAQNGRRMIIRQYLLRRIAVMKRDHEQKKPKQSRRILFDTIFDEASITNSTKKVHLLAREFVSQCLDYWQAMDYIKGYEVVKDGIAFRGFDVQL